MSEARQDEREKAVDDCIEAVYNNNTGRTVEAVLEQVKKEL